MEAHQGVLEVSHGVEGPSLDQESRGVGGLVELDQDDGHVLQPASQSASQWELGGLELTSRAASY